MMEMNEEGDFVVVLDDDLEMFGVLGYVPRVTRTELERRRRVGTRPE